MAILVDGIENYLPFICGWYTRHTHGGVSVPEVLSEGECRNRGALFTPGECASSQPGEGASSMPGVPYAPGEGASYM